MKILPELDLNNLRGDLFGGLTAAVVALPLALAFGVASGAGPIAGLYGAVGVGFFSALFGGTRSQVSGPTGPMTVVMAAVIAQYSDNLAEAFTIVMLGGVLQILFGALKLGRYVRYTPVSVVSGFMSGIGIIIILIQTLPFFGLSSPEGPVAAILAWPQIPAGFNLDALLLAALSLAIMVFWPKPLRPFVPPPLAALVVGTLAALAVLGDAPVLGEIPTGLPTLVVPDLPLADLPQVLQAAFILAVLGSIDSLLTSLVADQITRTRHDSDRELIGQGVGNLAAGLIGGLPGAGATMRTVINVRAGGRTPLSGALHAVVLLALLLGLAPLAEPIPHAVLAGILLKVGWDIIDWSFLKRAFRMPRDEVGVMLITFGLTVFVDLITAVAVGIILAGFAAARWVEQEQLAAARRITADEAAEVLPEAESNLLRKTGGRVVLFRMFGSFSYVSARELARAERTDGLVDVIIYDMTDAAAIDVSAGLALDELISEDLSGVEAVLVTGLSDRVRAVLDALGVMDKLPPDHLFEDRHAAIKAALELIDGTGGAPAEDANPHGRGT